MSTTAFLWLGLAVVLTFLEANTTRLVCLWFIIGAVSAFLLSLVSDSFLLQLTAFAVMSAVALIATRPLAKKLAGRRPVPTNSDMLIGRIVPVTADITPTEKGRVVAGGISYLATADSEIHTGQQVCVTAISGNTLKVKTI